MKRHALVIGAPLGKPPDGRPAEEVDVERMTQALEGNCFDVESLVGPHATRDGILAGYRRLIERVTGEDAAVVYFSGHGGMVVDADPRDDAHPLPKRFQFIAPTDYDLTTEDDFRGVSAWELSLLLEQLTARTPNVTVILDCCHAAQMSRDQATAGVAPRAIPKLTRVGIARHYAWVCDNLGPVRDLSPKGNPKAVRIGACGEWQSAFPTRDEHGRWTGALTHELLATLDEIGDAPVSWRAIGAALRARVLRRIEGQRPIVEGPVQRRPFSLAEVTATTSTAIPIAVLGERFRIDAGQLTGVAVGDVYGVTRLDTAGYGPETAIACVEIDEVGALHATARLLEWRGAHRELPANAAAWPLKRALPKQPVRIDAPPEERAALETAIAGTMRLRIAGDGERAIGELWSRGGRLVVIGDDRRPLERSEEEEWDLDDAVRQLEQLAAARALRELEGEHGLSHEEVEVEWGTVHGGELVARQAHGTALGLGDRIYVELRNRTQQVRFAHVFNIGLRGDISLVSELSGLGVRLGPGQTERLPTPEPAAGIQLVWPRHAARDEPGVDTLMVIVTTQAADLQALETDADAGPRSLVISTESPLERLLSQLHEGGTRSVAEADPFFVTRRSWVLHPLATSLAGPAFAIDEDPLAVHAALRPEVWLGGAPRPPRPLELRVRELSANRTVRIDALVCTRSAKRDGVYQARTLGPGGHDREVLWSGPVQDLLDIYLWVAPEPDGGGSGDRPVLDELLASALARPELAAARDALVVHDPDAPWSLAGGASLALARAAGELLRRATPETAGLLHTSFAAHENYGIGLQPATGLYRGHGVALGLEIVEIR